MCKKKHTLPQSNSPAPVPSLLHPARLLTLHLAPSGTEVEAAFREGRIASLIGVEGGHAIQNSLGVLRALRDLGVRYLTLTHTCSTPW